ncbi:VOC family protein [Candidatus Bathyarchaeota archaeon]|nr:VOC family protein [Candidatus Bathyarchaeota archaeon]
MFNTIDHIEIITRNMEASVKFYTEVLGFKPKSSLKMDGSRGITEIVFLTLGNTSLELLEFPDAAPIPSQPHVGYRMMAVTVDDMQAAIAHLRKHGVKITREPVNLGESMRGEFQDNNGVTIEIRKW